MMVTVCSCRGAAELFVLLVLVACALAFLTVTTITRCIGTTN
jgi:hypothetical protein